MRPTKPLISLCFLIASFSAAPSLAATAAWNKALAEMRSYCVAEICIGNSVGELESVRGSTLTRIDFKPPIERNCGLLDRQHKPIFGEYVTKDGAKFGLILFMGPWQGDPKDRLRVRGVVLHEGTFGTGIALQQDDIDFYRKTLTERFRMAPVDWPGQGKKEADEQSWGKTESAFTANVVVSTNDKFLMLALTDTKDGRFLRLLNEQPECHADYKEPVEEKRKRLPKL